MESSSFKPAPWTSRRRRTVELCLLPFAVAALAFGGCTTVPSIDREPSSSVPVVCAAGSPAAAPPRLPFEWIAPADAWAEHLGMDGPSEVTAALASIEPRSIDDGSGPVVTGPRTWTHPRWGAGAFGAALAPDGDLVVAWYCKEDSRPLSPRCTGPSIHVEKLRRADGVTQWDWVLSPDLLARAMPPASSDVGPSSSSRIAFASPSIAIASSGAIAVTGLVGLQPVLPARPRVFLAIADAKGREVFVRTMPGGVFERLEAFRTSSERFRAHAPVVAFGASGDVAVAALSRRSTDAADPDDGGADDGRLDLVVRRFAPDGTLRWSRRIAAAGADMRALAGLAFAADGIIVSGSYRERRPAPRRCPLARPGTYGFVSKIDRRGRLAWFARLNGPDDLTSRRNFMAAGPVVASGDGGAWLVGGGALAAFFATGELAWIGDICRPRDRGGIEREFAGNQYPVFVPRPGVVRICEPPAAAAAEGGARAMRILAGE